MNYFKLLPIKTKFLIIAGIVLILIFFSISFFQTTKPPLPQPSPVPQKINSLQRGIPEVTKNSEIESQLRVKEKIATTEGTIYILDSDITIRPDELRTNKEGTVIFERVIIPDSPENLGYMTLEEITTRYGQPEEVIQGSKFWGGFVKNYIYASKGFAFVANPHTKELFEMQIFTPMTKEEYKQKYGEDISGEGPVPEF